MSMSLTWPWRRGAHEDPGEIADRAMESASDSIERSWTVLSVAFRKKGVWVVRGVAKRS